MSSDQSTKLFDARPEERAGRRSTVAAPPQRRPGVRAHGERGTRALEKRPRRCDVRRTVRRTCGEAFASVLLAPDAETIAIGRASARIGRVPDPYRLRPGVASVVDVGVRLWRQRARELAVSGVARARAIGGGAAPTTPTAAAVDHPNTPAFLDCRGDLDRPVDHRRNA